MDDVAKLKKLGIPQLRNIIKKEGGNFSKSNSKEQLVEKILRNRRVNLLHLPPELLNIISSELPIKDTVNICLINKDLRNKCMDSIFWSNYFSNWHQTTAQVQDDFHKLLIKLASSNDKDFFNYLWNTPIKLLDGTYIMKERRSLFSGYRNCIINDNNEMAEIIYNIDRKFVLSRIGYDIDNNSLIHLESYMRYISKYDKDPKYWFKLKYTLIYSSPKEFENYVQHGHTLPLSTILCDILAHKTITEYEIVKEYFEEVRTGESQVTHPVSELSNKKFGELLDRILFETIVRAMKLGNINLAENLLYNTEKYEYIHNNLFNKYQDIRINYFSSPNVDAEKRSGVKLENIMPHYISFIFKNYDYLRRYLNLQQPQVYKKLGIVASVEFLSYRNIIDLIPYIIENSYFKEELLNKFDVLGYDYMINVLQNI